MSKFWSTQPVNKGIYPEFINGKIKELDKNMLDNYLPDNLMWFSLDVNDPFILNAIHEFLSNHYVTDVNNMYRLDYSKEFLKYGLTYPNYNKDLHLGLLYLTPGCVTLVGFIAGTLVNLNINKDCNKKSVVINFLCVHSKLRNKNLAPLLIKEITKRSVLLNSEIALYTVAKKITKPFSLCYYNNIYLNPKKLKECLFIPDEMNPSITSLINKKSQVNYTTRSVNINDIDAIYLLLNIFTSKYKVYQPLSIEQIKHMFINNNVIHARVIIENNTKQIIGIYSIYNISSRLLFDNKHSHINFSNLYYYYYDKNYISIDHIIKESVILSKKYDYDVFTCLNTMDNKHITPSFIHYTSVPSEQDGAINKDYSNRLYFYFYNYICNDIKPEDLGLLLF